MTERADAHIHLFEQGFPQPDGFNIDEPTMYDALAEPHDVRAALVVGYAGESWAGDNNAYIAQQAQRYPWAHPVAFAGAGLADVGELERFQQQGFVGISLYITNAEQAQALSKVPDSVWQWLTDRCWLVSVNSMGEHWASWRPILQRQSGLRLLISHLGLPPRVAKPPAQGAARSALKHVLRLADFRGPRVKLSGFYAITDPEHGYPHTSGWPYVEALLEAFDHHRLLWGSDFPPHLTRLSFPQTFDLFRQMPFLTEAQREAIEGTNLLGLLDEVRT